MESTGKKAYFKIEGLAKMQCYDIMNYVVSKLAPLGVEFNTRLEYRHQEYTFYFTIHYPFHFGFGSKYFGKYYQLIAEWVQEENRKE